MSGKGQPAAFVGYEEPPRPADIRKCRDWPERLKCLEEHHSGRWAKFGPFMSKKSAQHTGANLRGQMNNVSSNGLVLDTEVHPYPDDGEFYFLWLRVREVD